MTTTTRLTAAGFLATAVAFGPARMGFGLFLPAFRDDFALSTSAAGLIASGGFGAFLLALVLSAFIGPRYGERVAVIAGALSATAGFAAVAAASGPALLAVGIALAGASAGLCWAPFNDAAERVVPEAQRATALSVVSTGTTVGVLAAAVLSLAVTGGMLGWRGAWLGLAVGSLVLAGMAFVGMPPPRPRKRKGKAARRNDGAAGAEGPIAEVAEALPSLAQPAAIPLYASALCFGMTNAIFLSFAADRVVTAGGLPGLADEAASAVIFLGYGTCGVLGLATGRIEAKIGLAPLFCWIFGAGALSLVLIALFPTSWTAVLAASGLHGIAIMMVSAVFSFWSLRLFPGRGTTGFTVTLLGVAAGSVIGPAAAGILSEAQGPRVMFLAAAVPPLAATLYFATRLPRRRPRLPGAAE